MTGDSFTVMRAHDARLAKLVRPDGTIEDYGSAYRYDAAELPVRDLAHLREFLTRMLGRPDCAIVRGHVIDGPRRETIRRLLHPDAKTGDQPTLKVAARRWLAIDMDSIAKPENVGVTDIFACAAEAIGRLPPAFHHANCIAVATAGHGLKPGIRLRLWFWLSRPIMGVELKRWLVDAPIDKSVFSSAQLIYTAAPVFDAGRADHLPLRLAEISGAPEVKVPDAESLVAPPRQVATQMAPKLATTDAYIRGALARAAANIMRQQVGGRHPTLIAEGCTLARYVHANLLSESDMRSVLTRAAQQAGKEDPDEIDEALTWSLANPNKTPLPEGASGR